MLFKSVMVIKAAEEMSAKNIGCVIIVGEKNKIEGILTERDMIKRVILPGKNPKTTKISSVMTSPVSHITPNLNIETVDDMLALKHFRRFPVMEKGNLIGLVTETDLLGATKRLLGLYHSLQKILIVVIFFLVLFIALISNTVYNYVKMI